MGTGARLRLPGVTAEGMRGRASSSDVVPALRLRLRPG